jgi:hypothetical protein
MVHVTPYSDCHYLLGVCVAQFISFYRFRTCCAMLPRLTGGLRCSAAVFRGSVRISRKATNAFGINEEVFRLDITAGSFFGEAGLLSKSRTRRSATVTALDRCHLYRLSFADFQAAVADFPEYKNLLKV